MTFVVFNINWREASDPVLVFLKALTQLASQILKAKRKHTLTFTGDTCNTWAFTAQCKKKCTEDITL